MSYQGKKGPSSQGPSYVDALTLEYASERCVRCSALRTAAVIYAGSDRDYYYCYECRRWFMRDAKYRYATASLDEPTTIGKLLAILELQRGMAEAQLESLAWVRRQFSGVYWFFRRLARWPRQPSPMQMTGAQLPS